MAKDKRYIPKWVKVTLIPSLIIVIVCIALLITNAFIPVKYMTAYFVCKRNREEGELVVSFLDVGFGDCILAELPDGKTLLIDGGDGAYPRELSLLKYLNSRGVDTIDYLVCTSVKDEHCGGLADVIKYKSVKRAFIPYCTNTRINSEYYSFITALENNGVQYEYAGIGRGVVGDSYDYFFTFLSPTGAGSPDSEYVDLNTAPDIQTIENASIVTWLQFGETAFAFTSDARADTLKTIADKYEFSKSLNQPFCKTGERSVHLENCKVATLAAHGGDKNYSSLWYDVITPECTVVSVGKNFAGYPFTDALYAAGKYSMPLSTQEYGNIVIRATEDTFTVI